MLGPHRVLPGRLSVSRTFGDTEAKLQKYGGNPKVVVPEPEIQCFKIRENFDFILLGCDGIFDKLTSADVNKRVWRYISEETGKSLLRDKTLTCHEMCGKICDEVLRWSAVK